jgi:2-iminoacetate synthase
MTLVKSGQIANCCQPNALMTLKEYLMDYASEDTRMKGEALIEHELTQIPNEKVLSVAKANLGKIAEGNRDFRF